MRSSFSAVLLALLAIPAAAQPRLDAYISGGVGIEEREALNAHRDAMSEGPFLYARLAAGRYTVAATHGGETQRREVTVRDKGATFLALYWDDPAALGR